MQIFIDDSGDAGFKIEKGSSRYFVIAAIIFDNELEAEKTAEVIKRARCDMNFPDNVEFKFNKARKDVRLKFFEAVRLCNFRVRSIVVDKSILRSQELTSNKEKFIAFFIKSLLRHNNNTIKEASIKIDGSGNRELRRLFLNYLKKELNTADSRIIKGCRLVNSKLNVLIQLADMVAGATRISRETGRTDSTIYKEIIMNRIEDEWPFR